MSLTRSTMLIWCLGASFGSICCGATAQEARPTYNGHWWVSVTPDEQYGFVVGYVDCYAYDFKGPAGFRGRSFRTLRDQVGEFYQENGTPPYSYPVLDVLSPLAHGPPDVATTGGGGGQSLFSGEHSTFDGVYWGMISSQSGEKQLGFVEGYLDCHETLSRNEGGVFSRTPEEYRALITEWYDWYYSSGRSGPNPGREYDPISKVLFRFRDGGGAKEG